MKRNYIITVCAILLFASAAAQTSTQRLYIKGGSNARENFMKEMFKYPSFEPGIVEYKNGQRYKSNMNYNKVLGTVQFIDENGDTLSIANEESVKIINIGNDVYVYVPNCLLSMKKTDKVSIYKNEMVRIADKLKTGGYGIPNSTGTIQSFDIVDTRVNFNKIEINESLLVSKVTTYYLENDKGEIFEASKKNVLDLYPNHNQTIKSFIKSHNLDFSKEEHLLKLTDFLSKL